MRRRVTDSLKIKLYRRKFILVLISFMLAQIFHAQATTIGLLGIDNDEVAEGFTLFTPWYSARSFLINNCGQVIREWEHEIEEGLANSYLDIEGNLHLLRNEVFSLYDWDGNRLTSFTGEAWDMNFHHDFTILPNGHVIILFDEKITINEALELGVDSTLFVEQQDHMVIDGFAEFDLSDPDSITLVWEWHLKHHLIQDMNPLLNNFFKSAERPRRLNINFTSALYSLLDWTHFNGVDYNPELDQLVFSSRSSSEIYIIDHSTTTSEAADSVGGTYGFGGDFLWRWGNPAQYGQDSSLQQTFVQHNPNWNLYGPNTQEGMSLFNNENATNSASSSILTVVPQKDSDGNYIFENGRFGPDEPEWKYEGPEEEFFSPIMSSAQLLNNGNYISCLGRFGKFYEITPEGKRVWQYQNPIFIGPVPQFQTAPPSITFSIQKYPLDFLGFEGKDLSPNSILENFNSISNGCIQATANENLSFETESKVYPNPTSDYIHITSERTTTSYEIYDVYGKLISKNNFNSKIDISNLPKGSYFLKLQSISHSEIHQIIIH